MSVEQIVDPTFPPSNMHRSRVKSLIASMHVLEFDNRKEMITATWFMERGTTDKWMEDAVAEQGSRMVVKAEFKMDINGRASLS